MLSPGIYTTWRDAPLDQPTSSHKDWSSRGGHVRLQLLKERLVGGLDRMESPGSPHLQLRLVGCVLPDQLEPSEDATLLLARLGGELS